MKIVYVFAIVLLAVLACSQLAMAQIPRTISYQGVLADNAGTPKPDGSYQLTFRLYNVGSGGSALWTEVKTLLTTRGLFSTALGDQVPIPYSIKFDQPYWLGIQVAADPELTTRIPLTAVGYSFNSSWADTARVGLLSIEKIDTLYVGSPTQNGYIKLYRAGHQNPIVKIDNAGTTTAGGRIELYDTSGSMANRFEAMREASGFLGLGRIPGYWGFRVDGNYSSTDEPSLYLFGSRLTARIYLGATANNAVQLPDSSISAAEILDEPGIASDYNSTISIPTSGVTNVTSASINVPGSGYIIARARADAYLYGTTIGNLRMGIASNSTTIPTIYTGFGSNNEVVPSAIYRWGAMYTEQIFTVTTSGINTYYLNADRTFDGGTGALWRSQLTLTYYPTSYGTVGAAVPLTEAQKFESATPIDVPSDPSRGTISTEKMYKVDLRELELKAAKARAVAEKAERELMEAKMNDQIGSVSPDKR